MKTKPDQAFRVVRLPSPLLESMRRRRDAEGATSLLFLSGAVSRHLGKVVEHLASIGLVAGKGTKQPARLPFSTRAGTLDALKAASESTGLTLAQLLALCLHAATENPAPATPKKASQVGRKNSKRRR